MLSAQDRSEIGDLNARFAWSLDLHDFDALRELLTEDVHYVSVGREFFDREAVVASFQARDQPRTTRHGLGNVLLTEVAEGVVDGRSSWQTWASRSEPAQDGSVEAYMVADFLDTYVRTELGWRIAERVIVPVFRNPDLSPGAHRA